MHNKHLTRRAHYLSTFILSVITTLATIQAQAAQFLNKEIEVRGAWHEGVLHADKITTPNVRRELDEARLSGRIDGVDVRRQLLLVGPLQI